MFMLGFPVVYAILLPSIAYVIVEGLPLGLLTQRVTYALDSFRWWPCRCSSSSAT